MDANRFNKAGCLQEGTSGGWEWLRDGERVADIRFNAEASRLVLDYRVRWRGHDWEAVRQPVEIERTPCRFGGNRAWFLCSGVTNGSPCRRRVVHIYADGRYFLCRHCYRLAHPCQNEKPLDRLARRSNKLRDRLGKDDFGILDFPPSKPKGMHWRTYQRRCDEIEGIDQQIERSIGAWLS